MALKKYELHIFYDPDTDEIVHLSEKFSDCDEYRMLVDDEEVEIPKEMQEYIKNLDLDDIGVS
tara:strand:- start:376 stop:564 length:189 start_codon:yes stop_codon:yes gene_type:complete